MKQIENKGLKEHKTTKLTSVYKVKEENINKMNEYLKKKKNELR